MDIGDKKRVGKAKTLYTSLPSNATLGCPELSLAFSFLLCCFGVVIRVSSSVPEYLTSDPDTCLSCCFPVAVFVPVCLLYLKENQTLKNSGFNFAY